MLTIDRFIISLPGGFEQRGAHISRLVAEQLAATPLTRSARLDRLAPAPVVLGPVTGDRAVAEAVAEAILEQLDKEADPS